MSLSAQGSLDEISNEDIKHLVFRTEPEEVKFPIYRSKFKDQVRQEYRKNRDCHRTMGYAHGFKTNSPDQFLKKRSRKVHIAQVEKPAAQGGKKHVPVPRKGDWNQFAPRVEQNYLINNIRKAVRSVPPTGPSRAFDTAIGRRVHNCNLLIPTFQLSENFGKVPEYIGKIKKQIQDEGNTSSKSLLSKQSPTQKENEPQPKGSIDRRTKVLSEKEREELLKSLKNVWAELQREFQVLPVLNDTPPKVKRKEGLEAKLIEVEKDIKLIEENERIYIIQDPNDPRCVKPHEPDPCYQNINYLRRNTML
uniref:Enkurin n=1 Tax=Lygus hesperus TaxID=30085 RepID=A0A0A9YVG3_LYGHE